MPRRELACEAVGLPRRQALAVSAGPILLARHEVCGHLDHVLLLLASGVLDDAVIEYDAHIALVWQTVTMNLLYAITALETSISAP